MTQEHRILASEEGTDADPEDVEVFEEGIESEGAAFQRAFELNSKDDGVGYWPESVKDDE